MDKTIQIPVEDIESAVATLHLVKSAYESEDVANAYNNLQQTINYRPLTNELAQVYERLSGHLKDYVFDMHTEEEEEADG
jgi:hypothetical protein